MAKLNYTWQQINEILARAAVGGSLDEEIQSLDVLELISYNSSTVADVTGVVNSGKVPVCLYQNVPYLYAGTSVVNNVTYYLFSSVASNTTGTSATINVVFVSGTSTWGNTSFTAASSDSPTFTGNVTVPSQSAGASNNYAVSAEWVQNEFLTHYVVAGRKTGSTLGTNATAEGIQNIASGAYSHAGGLNSVASGVASFAHGNNAQATGAESTAFGVATKAVGTNSFSGGEGSVAQGNDSFAFGSGARAFGEVSRAFGYGAVASGTYASADGYGTTAKNRSQHVFGEYNEADPSTNGATARGEYAEIVGNGTSSARSNARTLDWDGNETLAGKLTMGAQGTDDMDAATVGLVNSIQDQALAAYIQESGSGAIVSFTDGADNIPMPKFQINFSPEQNLNGYDYPWPSGGGKNKLQNTASTTTKNGVTFTVASNGVVTVNGTASGNTVLRVNGAVNSLVAGTQYILSGCPSGGNGSSTFCLRVSRADTEATVVSDYGSGATFTPIEGVTYIVQIIVWNGYAASNKIFSPMIRLASETDATFAPYENIAPITGWTGANVSCAGKNLLKIASTSRTVSGVTFTVDAKAGTITLNGTSTGGINYNIQTDIDLPEGSYVLSSGTTSLPSGAVLSINTSSGNYSGRVSTSFTSAPHGTCWLYANAGLTFDDVVLRPMLRPSVFDDQYETHKETDIPITWQSEAGTVYGGYIDLVSGELTVTHGGWILDGTNITFSKSVAYAGNYYAGVHRWTVDGHQLAGKSDGGAIICSHLAYSPAISATAYMAGKCALDTSVNMWFFQEAEMPDVASLNSYLAAQYAAGTPVTVVGKLLKPITYQLTPQEVTTLLGDNTVWSDGDSVDLTWRCDTALYINKILSGITASE